ncbi:uncharacterized protein ACA1_076660 [Acanthamoeba castellanii str. Neff]|uniref:Uncharacterized protein n=1 Tax=Acanthamoeba castellanii (strain ATCC 30010 / Neff) TaxID=1257118 RepID=L8GM37_ACACF|nr:uncharacterized protein ACA1_076660 [Acanthamoeba castellanii str. Neff]ELR13813.1 hypothetical protein ACA1_076660 [Acanthamoeba castellanii str. Neff]
MESNKCPHHCNFYKTQNKLLQLPHVSILEANTASTFNPNMGQVADAQSLVSGCNWMIKWNAPVSINRNAMVTRSGFKYNLVGPIPGHYSSLYNQIVTSMHQINMPYWLFKGDYKFTIQPYDPSAGVGYTTMFCFSNHGH